MKQSTLVILVVLSVASLLAACGGPPPPADATVNGVTSIDRTTGEVEFSVSALNQEGELLGDGNLSNVTATVEQPGFAVEGDVCGTGTIEDKGPLTTILTLDASGSMSSNDGNRRRNGAAKLFVQRMSGEDRAAVSWFSSGSISLEQELTSDKALLGAAVDRATRAGGFTNFWGSSMESVNFLGEATGANKVAVMFTDGLDTSGRATPQEVINNAQAKGVRVFMIGLGDDTRINSAEMKDVATGTQGFYRNSSDAEGLEQLFNLTFNAAKASGCIDITFTPVPTPGTTVSGGLTFEVNNGSFTGDYSVTF